jgi:DNA-binding XRE family transcriptional regulator
MNKDIVTQQNSLKEVRESIMMGKSELARKARISAGTISRIEQGYPCRVQTQHKIILALGLKIVDKDKVFSEIN